MSALRQAGVTVRVDACLPMTENMPGDHAVKPGDILRMRNGRTIEVKNTDAEGRLLPADALCLAATTAGWRLSGAHQSAAGIVHGGAVAILSGVAVPQVIPVARIPGYRTEFAGTWSRGQFIGNVLAQTDPVAWATGDHVNSRRWYAYLHEFDHQGNHLESTVESPGTGEEARRAAMLLLEEWLAGIPGLAYGDIAIRPFQFEHDAITFGLIVEDGHGTDWAELYPDRLGFHAPWDGSYDT